MIDARRIAVLLALLLLASVALRTQGLPAPLAPVRRARAGPAAPLQSQDARGARPGMPDLPRES